ncbi:MAG: V-type ATP synthase subunit D [Promethearchaeota archaeon]
MSFREVKATKSNLMALNKRLSFAVKGANFLEFRREQLIFQINNLWNDYLNGRKEFLMIYKKSLTYLNQTYQEMGKNELNLISKLSKIQYKPRIHIEYAKKMGILVSQVEYEIFEEEKLPAYTFENTSHYIEDLIKSLKTLLESISKFSEIEDLLFKVSTNFKRINRRINGLKNVIIPKLKVDIKQIKGKLEENERENYVRLKKTKDIIIKQQELF